MPTLNEPLRTAECLVSEANGGRSREKVIIAAGSGKVGPCSVLGKLTANGKYVRVNPAAGDGSQTAAAVLLDGVDATSADQPAGAFVRACEVNGGKLDFGTLTAAQITTAKGQLNAATIIVREPVG